jgi:hypothetical protein
MNKKASTSLIIIILIGLFLFTIVMIFGIPYITITNASHTGIVTAIETTGIIFKTTTVYIKTDSMSSQEDSYCLIDQSLIDKLRTYEESKEKITITYNNYLLQGLKNCNGESGGIIIGIE